MSSGTIWLLFMMSLAVIVLFTWGFASTWGYLPGGALFSLWLILLLLVVVKPGLEAQYAVKSGNNETQEELRLGLDETARDVHVVLQNVPAGKKFMRFQ